MKTVDIIAKLQKLVEEHEPNKYIMGEHEIMFEVFEKDINAPENGYYYMGFSPFGKIYYTSDGVYTMIGAKESN
jgi:hypothetical protein